MRVNRFTSTLFLATAAGFGLGWAIGAWWDIPLLFSAVPFGLAAGFGYYQKRTGFGGWPGKGKGWAHRATFFAVAGEAPAVAGGSVGPFFLARPDFTHTATHTKRSRAAFTWVIPPVPPWFSAVFALARFLRCPRTRSVRDDTLLRKES